MINGQSFSPNEALGSLPRRISFISDQNNSFPQKIPPDVVTGAFRALETSGNLISGKGESCVSPPFFGRFAVVCKIYDDQECGTVK